MTQWASISGRYEVAETLGSQQKPCACSYERRALTAPSVSVW